jgi:cellulose biosynthesis protein BcsQ
VPSDIDPDNVDRGVVLALREAFGELITAPVPHSVAMKRSMNARTPIVRHEPHATATAPYRELAGRVLTATAHAPVAEVAHAAR